LGSRLNHKIICAAVVCGFWLIACSQSIDTPSINSPIKQVNTETCRSVEVNFKNLTPTNVRSVVNCLNGSNDALGPYKRLLDSAADSDIETVLAIYNRHIYSADTARLGQTLNLLDKMQQDGSLQVFENSLRVLIESKTAENLLPLLKNYLAAPDSELSVDPIFLNSEGLVSNLIKKNKLTQTLDLFAHTFDGVNARAAARLIATQNPKSELTSAKVADLVSGLITTTTIDGTAHNFLTYLTDSKEYQTFLSLDDSELMAFASVFAFQSPGDNSMGGTISRFSKLVTGADQPLRCMRNGNSVLKTNNLLKFVVNELTDRSAGNEINNFFLRELTFLYASTEETCNFSNDIRDNKIVLFDTVQAGYGDGVRAAAKILNSKERFRDLASFFKSTYIVTLAPILQESSKRNSLFFIARIIARDFGPNELQEVSDLLAVFLSSGEQKSETLLRKLFSDQTRPDLKAFLASLTTSFSDSRSGLGDLFASLAHGAQLSTDNPLQLALFDTLTDADLIKKIAPLLMSLNDSQNFKNALSFTAELSANGQLDRLINFMSEVLKSSSGGVGVLAPAISSFQIDSSSAEALIQKFQNPYPRPIISSAQVCKNVEGSLYEPSGENLFNSLKCMDGVGGVTAFSTLADHLKTSGILPQTASLLKVILQTSPLLNDSLNQASELVSNGNLQKISQAVSLMAQPTHPLIKDFEVVLSKVLESKQSDQVVKMLGGLLRDGEFSTAISGLISAHGANPHKIMTSKNDYRLRVWSPNWIKSQIHALFPDYSLGQVEKTYKTSAENFEAHNDAWKYSEGPYKRLGSVEIRNKISVFIRGILRPNSLEELIKALQGLGRNYDIAKFLTAAADNQRVAIHINSIGNWHPHIQSQLDQIETLTENSHFAIPFVADTGVFYMRSVAVANDLRSAMDVEHAILKAGLATAQVVGDVAVSRSFQNMLFNYSTISEMANSGGLQVFQQLFQAAVNSTPYSLRSNLDPEINHLGAYRLLNDVGFFQNLTLGVESLKEQNQLANFTKSLFGLCRALTPEGVAQLRVALENINIENFVDLLILGSEDLPSYQNLKDALFHFIPVVYRLGIDPKILLQALVEVVKQPNAWSDLSKSIIDDLKKTDGRILSAELALLNLNSKANSSLSSVVSRNQGGILNAVALGTEIQVQNRDATSAVTNSFFGWLHDDRLSALNISVIFNQIFEKGSRQAGFGDLIGQLLQDDKQRANFIQLLHALASNGDLSSLVQALSKLSDSPDLDRTLHFLFDNTSLVSLGFR
jgi:hypothetical protein